MRWTPGGRSSNLEDRRGASPGGFGFGGGGGGGAKMGLGGAVIMLVLSLVFGRNFFEDTGSADGTLSAPAMAPGAEAPVNDPSEEPMVQFMSMVLDSAQANWHRLLPDYNDAKLVLYRDVVESACGTAQSATGPFYCPSDQRVYIDLGFFSQLDKQFGAPGDFAQAYVLAHEIGHHVQNLTGVEQRVREMQQRDPRVAKQLSVALELQADCYAGVWGQRAARAGQLEANDLNEGLDAAAAVGDDRLQRMARGRVNPESFTHGSSTERRMWFKRGFDTGDPNQCNTFDQR